MVLVNARSSGFFNGCKLLLDIKNKLLAYNDARE